MTLVSSFNFSEKDGEAIVGGVSLSSSEANYRIGTISLEGGEQVDLVFTHSRATSEFIYLKKVRLRQNFLDLFNIHHREPCPEFLTVPGQLVLGFERTALVNEAVRDLLHSSVAKTLIASYRQDEMIVVPILREGIKYGISEGLYQNFGYFCNEVVTDPHHVVDKKVSIYGRRVSLNIFKDKDFSSKQRKAVKVAWIGDSIASGNIMLRLLQKLEQQFPNLERVEMIAPLATLRGIARLRRYWTFPFTFRVHVFETILNALPPDFYYSAHFPESGFHIDPALEEAYRKWWGKDKNGACIADTACAGYGWSESFFSPQKQLRMIDLQLTSRHHVTISSILKEHLRNHLP